MGKKGGKEPCAICGFAKTSHVKRVNMAGEVSYHMVKPHLYDKVEDSNHWYEPIGDKK